MDRQCSRCGEFSFEVLRTYGHCPNCLNFEELTSFEEGEQIPKRVYEYLTAAPPTPAPVKNFSSLHKNADKAPTRATELNRIASLA